MKTPTSAKRLAANRANAVRSTGPRTPEGKARSSQNARKSAFDPSAFAVLRFDDSEAVAALRADAISTYKPINPEEILAVERIAMARHALIRLARLETGFLTYCLDRAFDDNGVPFIIRSPELKEGDPQTRAQNHNYWFAAGFRRTLHLEAPTFALFLRYQAQTERLYRRAVEDFTRLRDLREELQNEPNVDPELLKSKPLTPPPPPQNEAPIPTPPAAPIPFPPPKPAPATR